ncbi:MAG: glycerophosphodiester phosphodiesterase family protein [Truepera sp.]|nr:glycerophosphodiester phosphodiesterase family protein [Truepera sp.]
MKSLLVVVFVALMPTMFAQGDPPIVQAHRGYSDAYPENTLLAFERAFAVGADRVETDLALTKDGVVVLMHDRTVNRTTDGSGPVHVLTLEQVRALDAGSWKDEAFRGERVPTLEETVALAQHHGGTLNLEVKTSGRPSRLVRDTVAAAVELVHEMGADEMVMFTSFDLAALAMVRELDPNLRVGILDWYEPGGRFDLLDVAIAEQFYAWSPKAEFATEDRIRRASEAGLHVFTGFGSTSPGPHQGALLSWGLQGFSTNIPEAFVDYLKAHGLR